LSKILCKICNKIINHSTTFDSFNMFAMKKHFESDFCTTTERKCKHSQSQVNLTFK
jgi:hypothetical protein